MQDTTQDYREREDRTHRYDAPTVDADAEPGARHGGEHRVEGIEEVFQSGDRGVDWSRESQQVTLDELGFQAGGDA